MINTEEDKWYATTIVDLQNQMVVTITVEHFNSRTRGHFLPKVFPWVADILMMQGPLGKSRGHSIITSECFL